MLRISSIVESIGDQPSRSTITHVSTLASGIDDFNYFEVAYYLNPKDKSAEFVVNLASKYRDINTFKRILRSEVWAGQTESQLRDALDGPIAIDEILLKTKEKYVWKYDNAGENRYRTRITIENGVVVA